MFIQGQATLNNSYGAINTLVLLISSFFMATAVHKAREANLVIYKRSLQLTLLCGLIFLCIKAIEYGEKFSAGFHIASNEFYRSYFSFTGFHMLHVVLGMAFLIYLYCTAKTPEHIKGETKTVEGIGLYWHMVDLLWVILFSLIYLVP